MPRGWVATFGPHVPVLFLLANAVSVRAARAFSDRLWYAMLVQSSVVLLRRLVDSNRSLSYCSVRVMVSLRLVGCVIVI